jgi:hypothetical protein
MWTEMSHTILISTISVVFYLEYDEWDSASYHYFLILQKKLL